MKVTKAISVLLFLLVGTQLNANDRSAKYLGTQAYQKQLYDLGVYWDRNILKLQENCTSQYNINPISFAIIKPMKFSDKNVAPVEGAWTFRYKFTRCNESIIYNSLNIARDNQNPKIIPLVPGTTNCDPILIKDLYGAIYANLALNNKKNNTTCKSANVLNTKVTIPQNIKNKMWEEQWTILECDRKIKTSFCFTPSKRNGTNWTMGTCKE